MATNQMVRWLRVPLVAAFLLGLCSCGPGGDPPTAQAAHAAALSGDLAALERCLHRAPFLIRERRDDEAAKNRTLLHGAATREVTEYLIERGAKVNATDALGYTPLHCARNADVVEALVAHGANLNARAEFRLTPLFTVQDAAAVIALLKHGADANCVAARKNTPLSRHVARGRPKIVGILLSNGADAQARVHDEKTPLHLAAELGHAEIVQLLIDAAVDLNAKDRFGATPLHYASAANHVKTAELLMQSGARVNILLPDMANHCAALRGPPGNRKKTIAGCTALDLAETDEMRQVLLYFEAKTGKELRPSTAQPATPRPGRPRQGAPVRPAQPPRASTTVTAPKPAAPPVVEKPRRVWKSTVGRKLATVLRELGPPQMRSRRGKTLIFLYDDREIRSRDGKIVHVDKQLR